MADLTLPPPGAPQRVEGFVYGITFQPARQDVLVVLGPYERHVYLQPGGTITWDGEPVTTLELGGRLMLSAKGANVVLHPRPDRYGAATEAEFTSVKE
jgi:hypothetical protein